MLLSDPGTVKFLLGGKRLFIDSAETTMKWLNDKQGDSLISSISSSGDKGDSGYTKLVRIGTLPVRRRREDVKALLTVVFALVVGSVSSLVTPTDRRILLALPSSSWSSMTLHLLPQSKTKPKATVAELEAESETLRVEIEQMRAEALRRLQNLQQILEAEMTTTSLDNAPMSTTTTRTKLNKYLDSTDDIADTSSVTKRRMEQLILDGDTFSTKMGWQDGLSDPPVGTQWKVSLSIGREPGTWMPTEWGKSGKRINVSFVIEFAESKSYDRDDFFSGLSSGDARILRVVNGTATLGPSVLEGERKYSIKDGGWQIARGGGPMGTDLLRFFIDVGNTRIAHSDGDVYLPVGRVYCSCGYFPSSSLSTRETLVGELKTIEGQISKLRKKKVTIRNPFDFDGIKISREIFRLRREAGIMQNKVNYAAITEPDRTLLRFTKDGSVGLTREGGVCCKVNKGPIVEYHILGRFSIASND